MANSQASVRHNLPEGRDLRVIAAQIATFWPGNHRLVAIDGLLASSELVVSNAVLQDFAQISPQYPGERAALDPVVCAAWLEQLAPLLDQWFGPYGRAWEMQAWYSLVTTAPADLLPIQRLPHVDGTDPAQIAMMLDLHRTGPTNTHGGTAFFRHRSTGLEALTADSFSTYARALQDDVAKTGLPLAAYAP